MTCGIPRTTCPISSYTAITSLCPDLQRPQSLVSIPIFLERAKLPLSCLMSSKIAPNSLMFVAVTPPLLQVLIFAFFYFCIANSHTLGILKQHKHPLSRGHCRRKFWHDFPGSFAQCRASRRPHLDANPGRVSF